MKRPILILLAFIGLYLFGLRFIVKNKNSKPDNISYIADVIIEVEEKDCYTQEEVIEYILKASKRKQININK